MRDNEIIKALECCHFKEHIVAYCDDEEIIVSDVLNIINRQKAEISELQHKNSELEAELDDLKRDDLPRCKDALRRANEMGMALEAEVERLNKVITTTAECAYESRQMAMKWARAEAIKEFAQDLKEALYFTEFGTPVVDVSDIDDFVKEMVGDDNENL